jgi:hypothetical protein
MALHMDIVPLQRLVIIVAHGEVTADDLSNNVRELTEAHVARYAKIIDVSASHWVLTKEQIADIGDRLRGDLGPRRTKSPRQGASFHAKDRPLDLNAPGRACRRGELP